MITCRACDTANRNGSRYCSHCGEILPASVDNACPACGQLNTCGSERCISCGLRMSEPAPLDASQRTTAQPAEAEATSAGTLDTPRPPKQVARSELPAWLYPSDSRAPAKAPEAAKATPSEAEPPATPKDTSRYLRGIRGVLPDTDGWLDSALSDYLADEAKGPSATTAPRSNRSD
jgi:hypothetical protein